MISEFGVIERTSSTKNILPCTFYAYDSTNKVITLQECQNTNLCRLYDLTGKEILSSSFITEKKIDVSFLTKGIYIILFYNKDNHEVYSGKILVL
ncbi:MAG: T9SS type A sorting domain-containing protein [Saprospiraceae bacterium]|nr:T9SS type A sorting domain-containing protein [Saprospiraceae bacterium]MBK9042950.1 T9SS type A sorting domain-containing protein [Saprospiraceae bacterium]